MFPLYDTTEERRSFPFINYLLIGLNIFAFYIQITAPSFEEFIYQYAFIPAEFSIFNPASYIYIFTSIFMHGGLLHIISNLWFLHIFGDNVEDRMGHFTYLIFYLLGGVAASLAQYAIDPSGVIPMIGASGAISAVSGAYFVLFKHAKIRSLVTLGFYISTVDLPAWLFLGYWFIIQVLSGFTTFDPSGGGGVAWFAHIGGFVFGWVVGSLFARKKMI